MEPLAVLAVLVLLVVGAFAVARFTGTGPAMPPEPAAVRVQEGRALVHLDVEGGSPDDPGVLRLVRESAARVFAAVPGVEEVVVLTRTGAPLGRAARSMAVPPTAHTDPLLAPSPAHPFGGNHPPLTDADDTIGTSVEHALARAGRLPPATEPVALADCFDLPPPVRRLLRDPDDPVELVRAILEAAGVPADVDGDVVRSGDEAVVVLRSGFGEGITGPNLSGAYLRFRRSGAARGVVVSPGIMPSADVRRREMLDPALLHAGADGIQRMADAVALGGNPLGFAAGPAVAAR